MWTKIYLGPKRIIHASQMFLYNDVSSYFWAVGPNRFHFLCKILLLLKCIAKKPSFNRFLKRPQLQRDQDSGLPVQVYGLTTPWHSRYRLSWREVVAKKTRFQFFLSFDFEKTGSHAGQFFSVLLFQSTLSCLRRNYIHCIDISRLFSSLHSITRNMHSCYSLEKR